MPGYLILRTKKKNSFLILQCTIHHSSLLFSFHEIVYFLRFLVLSHSDQMTTWHYFNFYGFVETLFLSHTWCALEKVPWATRRTHIPFAFLSEFYPVQFFSQSYTCLFWNPALFLCMVFIWNSLAQLWAWDSWLMWPCRAISQDSCVLSKALFRACVYFPRSCHPCWGTMMVLEAATVDTFHKIDTWTAW